jgi:hypothetical protein
LSPASTSPTAALPAAADPADLLGSRLGALLSQGCTPLPDGVDERLRVAREQALLRARQARRAAAGTPARAVAPRAAPSRGAVTGGGLGGWSLWPTLPAWGQRALAVLPLAVLLGGLLLVQQANERERIIAMAEFDAELLTGELHPVAYSDPGFAEFLRRQTPSP